MCTRGSTPGAVENDTRAEDTRVVAVAVAVDTADGLAPDDDSDDAADVHELLHFHFWYPGCLCRRMEVVGLCRSEKRAIFFVSTTYISTKASSKSDRK